MIAAWMLLGLVLLMACFVGLTTLRDGGDTFGTFLVLALLTVAAGILSAMGVIP